ncbi:hypothetical protein [Telluria aromaticivorans]|uniref:Uncharacterized protein n=1 Tax=Telluria aromaticivorans TaxID=2725995 RepID=A0A7Y2P2C5_9BURK|nr:hypothetical protein [Telluria aromaticivorans]NNG24794.1 hypothetical protein [Telluria aromaticivorans]
MKKYVPYLLLFLFALLLWDMATADFMSVNFDGDEIDGPLGAFLGLVFAGGGAIIGGLVMLVVGAVLAVVFAGLGVILLGALCVAAVAVALAISPLLLPLLVPIAIIWFLASRQRKSRVKDGAAPVTA